MAERGLHAGFVAAIGVLAACYSGRDDGPAANEASDDAGDGDDGMADDGGAADRVPGDDPGPGGTCGAEGAAASSMRRLTRLEYDNTVRDLLGDVTAPARAFTPDEEVAGFAANAIAPLSASQLDQYIAAAEDIAARAVTERWDELVGCDAATGSCAAEFIERFGRRAMRRPLTAQEKGRYLELFEGAASEHGAVAGIELVLQAMLLSPGFLYHAEPVPLDADPAQPLVDAHALASRLSYFLWASMPDDELLDAADAGALGEPDALEAQARRMLDDDRAEAAIASFHRQWLRLGNLGDLVKDPALFPEWDAELAGSMEHETIAFADEVIRRGDATLGTLLTASWSVIDGRLAEIYGVQAPADGFGVTELDPSQRAGLLTHASFLASNAHAAETSWVHRGKFVRENLLCGSLPPPPPGVEVNTPNDPNRLENPECNGCHTLMDPIGIGFDRYSAIGGFRAVGDDGVTISAEGEVVGVPEIGTFEGAVELSQALAATPEVGECVATQWFRFAARRKETPGDACALGAVQATFEDSGQDVRELIVAIVRSDVFRQRGAE